ncbi:MAG: DUF3795 domain-containing protein [Desulfobulbaceae bacterium]|jgi:hypothetical protein|nr:DUF3795 domain-containing protein [Desulfobulbaceae bacterium]
MNKLLIEMTAYCGLFCRDCLRYESEVIDKAKSLLSALEERKFDQYAEAKMQFDSSFEDYPLFIVLLKKIIALECKKSCRQGGGCSAFDCPILKCCLEKQYEGCWQCERLTDCDKFDFLKPFHGENPQKNCIDLRNNGFDNFDLRKRAFYVWDERPGMNYKNSKKP